MTTYVITVCDIDGYFEASERARIKADSPREALIIYFNSNSIFMFKVESDDENFESDDRYENGDTVYEAITLKKYEQDFLEEHNCKSWSEYHRMIDAQYEYEHSPWLW